MKQMIQNYENLQRYTEFSLLALTTVLMIGFGAMCTILIKHENIYLDKIETTCKVKK